MLLIYCLLEGCQHCKLCFVMSRHSRTRHFAWSVQYNYLMLISVVLSGCWLTLSPVLPALWLQCSYLLGTFMSPLSASITFTPSKILGMRFLLWLHSHFYNQDDLNCAIDEYIFSFLILTRIWPYPPHFFLSSSREEIPLCFAWIQLIHEMLQNSNFIHNLISSLTRMFLWGLYKSKHRV